MTISKTFLLEEVSVLSSPGVVLGEKGSPKVALRPWIPWPVELRSGCDPRDEAEKGDPFI